MWRPRRVWLIRGGRELNLFLIIISFIVVKLLPLLEPEFPVVEWLLLELLCIGRAFTLRGIKSVSGRMVNLHSHSLGRKLEEAREETGSCKDYWAKRLTGSSLLVSS